MEVGAAKREVGSSLEELYVRHRAVTIAEPDGSGATQVRHPDARSGSPLFWVPGTTGG